MAGHLRSETTDRTRTAREIKAEKLICAGENEEDRQERTVATESSMDRTGADEWIQA
jgi:hypothetical protein